MAETSIFTEATSAGPRTPMWQQFTASPTRALRVILLTAGGTVGFYLWTVAAAPFAIQQRHTDPPVHSGPPHWPPWCSSSSCPCGAPCRTGSADDQSS